MNSDILKVLISQDEIKDKIKELGEKITRDYKNKDLLIVGVLKGCVIFLSDLVREIKLPLTMDFMVVSSYGSSTKSSGVVRIVKDLEQDIGGKDVLIVEDIVDTGLTLNYLVDYLLSRHANSVKICTLLEKQDRRINDVELEYVGFHIPDEFVVGYGLDYDEVYRNLPFVCILKPDIYSK